MPKNYKRNKHRNRNRNRRRGEPQLDIQEARKPTYTKEEGVVDYLSEDEEISSQRYGCISFASITDDMKDEICSQIAGQLGKPLEEVKEVVQEWCSRENPKRAVKVRGTFKTLEQTYRRAEEIRNYDANFHIFTCEVGKWLPFDPDPSLLEDENYMEGQLNELLKGYKENRLKTKQHYDQRKRDLMEKAIQEGTPEGQQQLIEAEEPVEAVKHKAEQAEESIAELKERIAALERTRESALRKLETMGDVPAEDARDKVEFGVEVENTEASTIAQDLEAKANIEKMRSIQEKAKKMETKEFAQHLAQRQPAQPKKGVFEGTGSSHDGMFGSSNIIPSQIRENYTPEEREYTKIPQNEEEEQ